MSEEAHAFRPTIVTWVLACLMLLLMQTGCAALLRQPKTPFPESWPDDPSAILTRELLTPQVTKSILFVVKHSGGRKPEEGALNHLVTLAERYAGKPARWVWAKDGPRLIEEHDENTKAVLRRMDPPPSPDTSYVFIEYRGDDPEFPHAGGAWASEVRDERGRRQVYQILINQEVLRPFNILWLTQEMLERGTLIHEYGHLLGFVCDPAHGYFPVYPSFWGGAHCCNPDCALSLPKARTVLYCLYRTGLTFRYYEDYCTECQADIQEARSTWEKPGTQEYYDGVELLSQVKYREAHEKFRTCIQLGRDDDEIRCLSALCLHRMGKYREACEDFAKVVQHSNIPDRFYAAAVGHYHMGRQTQVCACLRIAAQLDPKNAVLQRSYGLALANTQNYQGACTAFKTALELGPKCYATYAWYVWTLKEMGRTSEAIAFLEATLARVEKDKDPDENLLAKLRKLHEKTIAPAGEK